jgi:hypothetical protein
VANSSSERMSPLLPAAGEEIGFPHLPGVE